MCAGVVAEEAVDLKKLVHRANTKGLSQHPVWLKLLHYDHRFTGVRSGIHDPTFFNALNGRTHPADELEATLRALLNPQRLNDETHGQCRFPARYIWLKKQLQLTDDDFPKAICKDFSLWTFNDKVKSISMVYVSGYLGNPATYYGHTLLKLNSSDERQKTRLLDQSVNYGVILPDNEGPISYIVKSLFGGYDGGFSHARYHFHTRNYGEIELRDLWEYELNLEKSEVDFVVAHVWEILGKNYTYYFFRENCAYRLAELFEIVDGIELIPANPVFTLPRSVLQQMSASKRFNQPLVRSILYHPSRQSRLYKKYLALSSPQKKVVKDVVIGGDHLRSKSYQSLPPLSKQIILDTLLDYHQFAKQDQGLEGDDTDRRYQELLVERFSLPPRETLIMPVPATAPHEGRNASHLSIGFTNNNTFGDGLTFALRPAYYDVLDAGPGQVRDSALAMGEVKLVANDNQIKIRHIDVFKIESINPGITELPGDNGNSWKLKFGVGQKNLSCLDCLVTKLEGDYGFATRLHSNLLVGAFIGGGLQDKRYGDRYLFAKASMFSHLRLTDQMKMRLLVEIPEQIDSSAGGGVTILLQARQSLGVNMDLRFSYERDVTSEYSLSLGYYF